MTTSQLQDTVTAAAQRYGVDPALALGVAKTESAFNPNAVSSAGAIGIMQLMPATAAGLGVSNPYDPVQNIDGGVRYLSQLLQRYNGDVTKTLWAYNAGPGNVAAGNLPSETVAYIPAVLNNASLFGGAAAPDYGSGDSMTVPPDAFDSTTAAADVTAGVFGNSAPYVWVGLGILAIVLLRDSF